MFYPPFAVALGISLLWTILFSMSLRPAIRGYRKLGILSAYVCLLVFLVRSDSKKVALTWACFGLAGGVCYTLWETIQRVNASGEEKPKVGFAHVFPGLFIWPIMIPEAIEYALASFGFLKTKP